MQLSILSITILVVQLLANVTYFFSVLRRLVDNIPENVDVLVLT